MVGGDARMEGTGATLAGGDEAAAFLQTAFLALPGLLQS